MMESPSPAALLFVDLDGSLLATDSLWESFVALVRRKPRVAGGTILRLTGGRAAFKRAVSAAVDLDAAALPYRQDVLAYVRAQHAAGREIVLATAADQNVADRVAAHLGLFTAVIASDGIANLRGRRKLQAIRAYAGGRQFDYLGDGHVDRAIWEASATPLVVARSPARGRALAGRDDAKVFVTPRRPSAWVRALRPHQWAKNLLLVVPAMAAHTLTEPGVAGRLGLALLAFCLAASGGYLVNDLLDLEADRRHPDKHRRPLASGQVSIVAGAVGALGLLVVAASIAFATLPPAFGAALGGYVVLTLAYSTRLKSTAIVDVLVLSGLYVLRIIAGGVAVEVPVSPWLLAFAMFVFLSLAFVKRYSELHMYRESNVVRAHGRGYRTDDLEIVRAVGPASGYMAVLVLALYVNSDKVITLYRRPEILWLLMPLLLYWITRMWFLAGRGRIHHDPVVFALTDRVSYLTGGLVLLLVLLAA